MRYTFYLSGAALGAMILTEVLRSIVRRTRERQFGIGGTQDIAMWGAFIGWGFIVTGVVIDIVRLFGR